MLDRFQRQIVSLGTTRSLPSLPCPHEEDERETANPVQRVQSVELSRTICEQWVQKLALMIKEYQRVLGNQSAIACFSCNLGRCPAHPGTMCQASWADGFSIWIKIIKDRKDIHPKQPRPFRKGEHAKWKELPSVQWEKLGWIWSFWSTRLNEMV